MKFRAYGKIKDSKTARAMAGVIVKLYLDEEELQKGKSAENGFYELIVDIDDSRIEAGQQLNITFEKGGFEKQEHRIIATEGAFNLDIKLNTSTPREKAFQLASSYHSRECRDPSSDHRHSCLAANQAQIPRNYKFFGRSQQY